MSIFRFMCMMRGYHRSSYGMDLIRRDAEGKVTDLFGSIGPCFLCRTVAPSGKVEKSAIFIEWSA